MHTIYKGVLKLNGIVAQSLDENLSLHSLFTLFTDKKSSKVGLKSLNNCIIK